MDEITCVDISFVIIGYNEGENLQKCLASVQSVHTGKLSAEIIYVDGGSQDDSIEVAKAAGIDRIIGGGLRRSAAENRNLGYKNASGRFIQFIDGDMVINSNWPKHAAAFLTSHEQTAAVCGKIREMNPSAFYQALQIDWSEEEGEVDSCGGSAMWRREVLEAAGGFPETVAYGEEPYLCWHVRNNLRLKINYLDNPMVDHDLNYSGFLDYWRRNVRCGKTYAEIAHLCYGTPDQLWLGESISNLVWGTVLLFVVLFLLTAPLFLKVWMAIGLCALLLRKVIQMRTQGKAISVSLGYAVHVYVSKLPLALGECIWLFRWLTKRISGGARQCTKGTNK